MRPSKAHSMIAVVVGTALSALTPSLSAEQIASEETIHNVSRYCTACWRKARVPTDRWGDCTQEVLCRLLERVPGENWSQLLTVETEERRELIRAIDTIKKREQRRKKWNSDSLDQYADRSESPRNQTLEERASVTRMADEILTSRQKQIVELSLDGWSVQDIGRKLDLAPERVSDEKYKSVRKLRARLTELE